MLVAYHASSLRELRCSTLCDDAVLAIAALKLNLQVLGIVCDNLSRPEGLVQLCASMPQLLELCLHDSTCEIVTASVMQKITNGCCHLKSVKLHLEESIQHDTEAIVTSLSACSSMEHVVLEYLHKMDGGEDYFDLEDIWDLNFSCRAFDKKRLCDVKSKCAHLGEGQTSKFPAICRALAGNGIGVRKMVWTTTVLNGGKSDLRLLADTFGPDLEELDCNPCYDIHADCLNHFFSCCPNLTVLCLGRWNRLGIDNACIAHLAEYCPKITTLQLDNGTMTEDAMIALLEGYRGGRLKVISFLQCDKLSDLTLFKIVELFPVLDVLIISGKVTRQALCNVLVSGALTVKQVGTSDIDNAWLKEELTRAVGKTWTVPNVDSYL